MRTPTILMLSAGFIALAAALPSRAETVADLPKLVAEAAQYESGQSAEPIQKIEQLLRDSAARPALKADIEAAMVKLLATPGATFEARRFACQILAVVGTEKSLPAVAGLLAGKETVGIGCLALSNRHSPRINEILRSALATSRGLARIEIISALGNHRDAQSVKSLVELAHGADDATIQAAIVALSKIGGPAAQVAIDDLANTVKPPQFTIVTEALMRVAAQLAAAGDAKAAAAIYTRMLRPAAPANVRRGGLAALLALDADGGQRRILDTLAGGDPLLVPVAIARVSRLKSEGASATFAALLPRLPPAAQVWMIEALASRADAPARSAVRGQVSAPSAEVRHAAVAAVGKLDDASAVPLLAGVLARAASPEELQDVEAALSGLRGGPATDKAIVAQLSRSSAEAKALLFSVLARRGARTAVPALLAEAAGSEVATVQAALRALGKIAAGAELPALLEMLVTLKNSDTRADAEAAAARAMSKTADAAQRSGAVRAALAKCSGVEARSSLLRLLPYAGDTAALAAIQAAARDKEAPIRDAAIRALASWPDATGWDAILAVFRRPASNIHRALALRGLVRLAGDMNAKPDAALVARYRELLAGARNDDDRKLVLSALAGAAHPDALELALPLLSQPGVRAETELAVKKIAAAIKAEHPQAAQAALLRLRQPKPKSPK